MLINPLALGGRIGGNLKKQSIPKKTRRLTRGEAAKLGVSYSAKLKVSASIAKGKATSRTPRFTDRAVATANIRRRELEGATTRQERKRARSLTKEKFTSRRVEKTKLKSGLTATTYNDLSRRELTKRLREHAGGVVTIKFFAEFGGRGPGISGTNGAMGWRYAIAEMNVDDLLDNPEAVEYVARISGALTTPTRFGVTFRE